MTTASNMAKAKVTMPQITIEQPEYIYTVCAVAPGFICGSPDLNL
jgi:hypothetical protein